MITTNSFMIVSYICGVTAYIIYKKIKDFKLVDWLIALKWLLTLGCETAVISFLINRVPLISTIIVMYAIKIAINIIILKVSKKKSESSLLKQSNPISSIKKIGISGCLVIIEPVLCFLFLKKTYKEAKSLRIILFLIASFLATIIPTGLVYISGLRI